MHNSQRRRVPSEKLCNCICLLLPQHPLVFMVRLVRHLVMYVARIQQHSSTANINGIRPVESVNFQALVNYQIYHIENISHVFAGVQAPDSAKQVADDAQIGRGTAQNQSALVLQTTLPQDQSISRQIVMQPFDNFPIGRATVCTWHEAVEQRRSA